LNGLEVSFRQMAQHRLVCREMLVHCYKRWSV